MEEIKINYDELNKAISEEKSKLEEQGGEQMNPEDMAHMMEGLSTSLHQGFYVSLINKYVSTASKRIKAKKNEEYEMPACSIFQVLMNGYMEYEWDDVFDVNIMRPGEINFQIADKDVVDGTVFASRILLKDLERNLKKLKGNTRDIDAISKRNVIEHIYINWISTIAKTYQDKSIIDRSLKGFKSFEIVDDTKKENEDTTANSDMGKESP